VEVEIFGDQMTGTITSEHVEKYNLLAKEQMEAERVKV
jgi:hypothetical protein